MNELIKILLVEDDPNLGSLIKEFLEIKDYKVNLAIDGIEGGKAFDNNVYDLIILDIMMPKKDGFTLAREIRKQDEKIPLIFLTAKSLQVDKIEGFKIGADDYITKPFNTEELLLRINAILKRSSTGNSYRKTKPQNVGKYIFDYSKRELTYKRIIQSLTYKEAELLRLLCENKNHILRRELALKEIWSEETYFTSRSMDVYITKLRNYLKNDKSIVIENVHGVGFKLLVE